MEYKINPRDGMEVCTNNEGNIMLKQRSLADGEALIVLHPDEVLELIGILQKIHQEVTTEGSVKES